MKKGHRSDLVSAVRVGSLRRQFLSAFCAPSLQDETAAFRLHTLAETMRLLAPMVIRLIRHLHQDPPPQKKFQEPLFPQCSLQSKYKRTQNAPTIDFNYAKL